MAEIIRLTAGTARMQPLDTRNCRLASGIYNDRRWATMYRVTIIKYQQPVSYNRARRLPPGGHRLAGIPAELAGILGSARRCLTGISREGFLGIALILSVFGLVFYLATRPEPDVHLSFRPDARQGFHSVVITEELSLQETARNWKYYQIMTSVCHRSGHQRTAAAYAYLFYSANRYSLNGKWSSEQFDTAVESSEGYYDIDPAIDCAPDSANLHGLDIDADLWLMTRALNYVFYTRKVPICEQAGNKVQARTYTYLADSELAKLKDHKWSAVEVNSALANARVSPDLHRITGC